MNASFDFEQHCQFPALAIYHDYHLSVFETMEGLVVCGNSDLKAGDRGRFGRATIIDSKGELWRMQGAIKLHGVGRFWGYSLLLGRTIRVRPNITEPPTLGALDTIKKDVCKCLHKRDGVTLVLADFCTSIARREVLRVSPLVESASSVPEIIRVLLAMDFPERTGLGARHPA